MCQSIKVAPIFTTAQLQNAGIARFWLLNKARIYARFAPKMHGTDTSTNTCTQIWYWYNGQEN